MSISKEEREGWRGRLQALREKGESEVAINLYTFSDVLNQLDAKDERITELQNEATSAAGQLTEVELERDYLRRENQRLKSKLEEES